MENPIQWKSKLIFLPSTNLRLEAKFWMIFNRYHRFSRIRYKGDGLGASPFCHFFSVVGTVCGVFCEGVLQSPRYPNPDTSVLSQNNIVDPEIANNQIFQKSKLSLPDDILQIKIAKVFCALIDRL